MNHIKVELDFIPVEEKPMPRGREFLVLFTDEGKQDVGRAMIEDDPPRGEEGLVWDSSMGWTYDECEGLVITHWAEMPKIGEQATIKPKWESL